MLTPAAPAPRPPIHLGIANRSTIVKDRDAQAFAEAFQVQLERDFAPAWPMVPPVRVTFVPKRKRLDLAHWWLVILNDADQAGALGYHDVTPRGLPIGKAFARTTLQSGGHWTVTAGHEGLEMLGDPQGTAITPPIHAPRGWGIGDQVIQVILENADACEDDQFGYSVDGILMSDFVTPAWFRPDTSVGTPLDFRGHIVRPLELLPGGYISYQTVDGNWAQVFAQDGPLGRHKHHAGPAPGSRLERLLKPRHEWQRSTAEAA